MVVLHESNDFLCPGSYICQRWHIDTVQEFLSLTSVQRFIYTPGYCGCSVDAFPCYGAYQLLSEFAHQDTFLRQLLVFHRYCHHIALFYGRFHTEQ